MKLIINGTEKKVEKVITISDLLKNFNLKKERVAVELNREIKNREEFEKIMLKENDRLEIITLVGGG